jgi:hypothetical protein
MHFAYHTIASRRNQFPNPVFFLAIRQKPYYNFRIHGFSAVRNYQAARAAG